MNNYATFDGGGMLLAQISTDIEMTPEQVEAESLSLYPDSPVKGQRKLTEQEYAEFRSEKNKGNCMKLDGDDLTHEPISVRSDAISLSYPDKMEQGGGKK